MGRIETICSYLDKCGTFADIGCDHGYCTEFMLKSGNCSCAIISDVSAKCLKKAEDLLADYIEGGKCKAICCDGLQGIPTDVEQVLIAGMGGEEIIKILREGFIPQSFVLQPMRNLYKVRKFLLESGCEITADNIFYDDKYYFIIKGRRAQKAFGNSAVSYSETELHFGKDSLNNPLFAKYAEEELLKQQSYLISCKDEKSKSKIQKSIDLLTEALK